MDISTERKALNVSQADIAARLGVHQTTILRWEKGELKPRPRDLMAVRVALDEIVSERDATQGKAA